MPASIRSLDWVRPHPESRYVNHAASPCPTTSSAKHPRIITAPPVPFPVLPAGNPPLACTSRHLAAVAEDPLGTGTALSPQTRYLGIALHPEGDSPLHE
jgi:hypothetical protein